MKHIILNDKYKIERDNFSWVLKLTETRIRFDHKTKKDVEYEFNDSWYYPDIKQILKKFIELDLSESSSIEEIIKRLDNIDLIIESFNNTIFKP